MSKRKKAIVILIITFLLICTVIGILYFSQTSVVEKMEVAVKGNSLGGITVKSQADKWNSERITVYTDTSMKDSSGKTITMYVPIPKGYVVSSIAGEKTVKEGLVIYEGESAASTDAAKKTRNQWVWVPVDPSEIYWTDTGGKKYGVEYTFSDTGSTVEKKTSEPIIWYQKGQYYEDWYLMQHKSYFYSEEELENDLQISFNRMVESVKKYGGYYIGRYEVGDSSGTTNVESNSNETGMPVVMKEKTIYNNITWYKAYDYSKLLSGENENVETNLIWGTQWDNALRFLVKTGNKTYSDIKNPKDWGNYNPTTFSYKNLSGATVTKAKNASTLIPAGSSEYTKACNIYDMAGNIREWSAECYSSDSHGMCNRGGIFYNAPSNYPANTRNSYAPQNCYSDVGWRAALYISVEL